MITTIIEDEAALLPGVESEASKQAHNSNIISALFGSTDRAAEVQEIADSEGWEAAPALLSASQRAVIERIADEGRDAVIAAIRKALRVRSGKPWSVTGGRGTAWGWITVESPPARRTQRCRLKAGALTTWPDDYEMYNSGEPGGSMLAADAAELAALLGIEPNQCRQHWSIPAQRDYYRVALCQAMHGHDGGFTAKADWD